MKCDICGSEMERKDGFVLTSSEVAASQRYWANQLPKFKHAIAALDGRQARTEFIVERVAEYALDASGWLACPPCSQLFLFDLVLARQSALDGRDRPDLGPADLQMALSAARPVIDELSAAHESVQVLLKTKKHWQCIRCGALYIKDDSRELNEMLLQSGTTLVGGVTCADCRTRYDVGDIYSGRYDMEEDDEVVAAAIADPVNTHMDKSTMTWYHNGRPLAGPRALPDRKPWWKFWA